jgi:squalene-hopene/tetraprenyl-beta-curcumene cyclase
MDKALHKRLIEAMARAVIAHSEELTELDRQIAGYLHASQGADGGWPLFFGGALDLSASVKAYFALKAAGDPVDAPHMARARAAILARGGARRCNVFTRIMLALWGEVPWRAVPVMPVEIMLLPGWFPFHIDKISYWSRTVLVPLLVLMALRPVARAAMTCRSLAAWALPHCCIRCSPPTRLAAQ